jgi:hypothetical protein
MQNLVDISQNILITLFDRKLVLTVYFFIKRLRFFGQYSVEHSTRFGPLRPFDPFFHLEFYKAENQMANSKLVLEK